MSESQYLIGIDLGTSNCALAFVERSLGADARVNDFPIPQLHRPAEALSLPVLPSCLYLAGENEFPAGALRLPWGDPDDELIVGELARWRGAQAPGRLVASAKSWLCHPGIDRAAPVLPWGAPAEVKKISPLTATARLLQHLTAAWDHAHPGAPLARQEVIVTVPASFDEAARGLTVEAARQAGFGKFTLLEEPQAAFYDFTARLGASLDEVLRDVRLVLIIDVGGGTSDFTLVQAGAGARGLVLKRIAVGEHLMLGGDNMDAALARALESRLVSGGARLGAGQWQQLVQSARLAKEALLGANPPESWPVAVAAESSRLVGRTLSGQLSRQETETIVLEGFFPRGGPDARRRGGPRSALQEIGLPFARDPAVTRHLAEFLRAHAAAGFAALGIQSPGLPRPDALLLNGGVFNSPAITGALMAALSDWWPGAPPPPLLRQESLELAVARGAAWYGLARHGLGRKITGGAAHALYVGVGGREAEGETALCVIPRGQEEGEPVEIRDRTFHLALNQPVRFPIYSTTADRLERAGELAPVNEEFRPLPPIHTLLKSAAADRAVPVHLRALLTEIGTLELWCVSDETGQRWRLEFELRGAPAPVEVTATESMPPSFEDARAWIGMIFGGKGVAQSAQHRPGHRPRDARHLWDSLEKTLGSRDNWRAAVLRELWSVLFAGARHRRRSDNHERVFFQLLGFCLRPGFGYALDDWRAEESAKLFAPGVQFIKDKSVWGAFWICWRRLAGGLAPARQAEIWASLKPFLAWRVPPSPAAGIPKTKGIHPEGLEEMVRLAAALEHLDPAEKTVLGDWIVQRIRAGNARGTAWTWALGRLGARVPIYGGAQNTVTPQTAEFWAELLLAPEGAAQESSLFALAQITRLSGDRARDLREPLREAVADALRRAKTPPTWLAMVTEVAALETSDKARALGDTLPVGLSLAGAAPRESAQTPIPQPAR